MLNQSSVSPVDVLHIRFSDVIAQAQADLCESSLLHSDFVIDCINSISEKSARAAAPLLGQIFPHLVAEGLHLSDHDRRKLAAAWLALYGYICLVDFQLDRYGSLNGRSALSASALLSWGIGTISRIASDSPFADAFSVNVSMAFSAQYADINKRAEPEFDRAQTDADKNRAIVAIVAAYCAASGATDNHLIRATELMLGPFQMLDDFQDLLEDLEEGNLTSFARMAAKCSGQLSQPLSSIELYRFVFKDAKTVVALTDAIKSMEQAVLLLDHKQDASLVAFLMHLREQLATFSGALQNYQSGTSTIGEPELLSQLRQINCHS
jgi:hypothetical protein